MSSAEQQPEKDVEEESTSDSENTENPAQEKQEEWDGVERRSKDRPWSNVENKQQDEELSDEEREALSSDVNQLTDEKGVAKYDFYSPAHINRTSLPALAVINEKIVDLMQENLSELLQREIEVTTDEIDISRYGEFIYSLPKLVDTNIVNVSKIDSQALVCIDGTLIEIIMDAYFGGEGKLSEENEKVSFTETELKMSHKLFQMFIEASKSAWAKTEKLDFQFVQREYQPKLINLLEESDLMVVCMFKVSFDEEVSQIRIAYPYKALEPIKESLRSLVPDRYDENNAQWKIQFFNSIKQAPVELKTILTEFQFTVDGIVNLKLGDVIPFSMPESVTVYSSKTPVFKGKVGSVNDVVAISIESWIRNHEH